jgi:catechol 2,3-dioxygenase-like lactoylglutathione lyase family enzyme
MNDMAIRFTNPAINYYVEDVEVTAQFYIEHFGFVETFRTPKQDAPVHVEITLGSFVLGIESNEAGQTMHGLPLGPGGFPRAELVLRTENVDETYAMLMEKGVVSIRAPHNLLSSLRVAWVGDPDGNPVRIVTRSVGQHE